MASEGAELDLYADDIGDEFSQENEYNDSDLYDDVITSNSKSRASAGGGGGGSTNAAPSASNAEEPAFNGNSNQSQNSNHSNTSLLQPHPSSNDGILRDLRDNRDKKPCVYVGNLTWWTTDEDVTRALNGIGVNDVVEIKFFENRANGQSKGFCVVTLQQENSVRLALEKLPKIELHGQAVQATMCNRQNLNNFEMKSRKPGQNGQPPNQNSNQMGNFMGNNRPGTDRDGAGRNFGQNQNMPGGPTLGRQPLLPRGPLAGRPNGPLLTAQPRLPQLSHQLPFGANPQQWTQLMQNGPRSLAPLHNTGGPTLNPMMRMPQGNRSLSNQPLLSGPNNQGDLRMQLSSVGLSGVGQHGLGPSHVNPLFGSQQSLVGSNAGDQFGNRFGGLNPYAASLAADFGRSGLGLDMSEAEFEEILSKNKNLANNAVTRAVSDAASGDYNAAVDTLATAISLISQSRVSHDDRCKIIISSLKDTLNGIESRGGGRKDRPRSRERSRERGGSRRDKSRRSRSREYRERSRDRHYDDRHYDDRYREKESDRRDHHRDRERDHRSSRH